jgi:hypothetical protein
VHHLVSLFCDRWQKNGDARFRFFGALHGLYDRTDDQRLFHLLLALAVKLGTVDCRGDNEVEIMFRGRQHTNGQPVSATVDDEGKEERAGSFGGRFRKSWQRFTEASRSASISPNTSGANVDEDNGISDLLDEVDQNGGSSILLRRADKISLSYYSPTSQPDDTTKIILSEFE